MNFIRKLRPSFIVRSIANRIISKKKISAVIYRLFGYKPLSYLLFLSVEKGQWSKEKQSVLCIKRDIFDKDIIELRKRAGNFNWMVIGTPQLAYIQSAWVPEEIRQQRVFQKYFTKKYQDIWDRSKLFAEKFLELAMKRLNVKALLSANIDYWQDESIRRACKAFNVPFLVLSKENCTIPRIGYEVIKNYKKINFKFNGSGIAVFSQLMKDVLIKSGVCKSKDIYITGAPRMDMWQNIETDKYCQDTITLLPYRIDYGLKTDRNFRDVLSIFLSFARKYRNSSIHFVIKCRNQKHKMDLERIISKRDLKFIELIVNRSLLELYPRSRLVIGHNSLAQVEALLIKTVIVVPQWGDIGKDYELQQFNPGDKTCASVLEFVRCKGDLEKLLEKMINNPVYDFNMEKRMSLLRRYMFYEPGKSNSKNVEEFVLSHVK